MAGDVVRVLIVRRGKFMHTISKKAGQTLCIILVITICLVSAQSVIPDELHSVILSALSQADSIGMNPDPELSRELIQSVIDDLKTADALTVNYTSSGEISQEISDVMLSYIDSWKELMVVYGYLIDGGEQKNEAYTALLSNSSDRYDISLAKFTLAKDYYSKAYEALEGTEELLKKTDADALSDILPDASIPDNEAINKMLFRLRDNTMICQAYIDLCSTGIAKASSGDANSTEVQEPLVNATTLMKKLIPSPFVGEEAALFVNITFS